jgi:hypothetical protein
MAMAKEGKIFSLALVGCGNGVCRAACLQDEGHGVVGRRCAT